MIPSISILQHGSADGEDLIAINAFRVDLNLVSEAKHRMSLTDEQINPIVTDSTRMIDSSPGQYLSSSIISKTAQFSPSIITSEPYKPQSIMTTSMPQNVIEKPKYALLSKFLLFVNTQVEYQQKRSPANINNITGEDDDVTPSEPPTRTDFGKKDLRYKQLEHEF
ncbi:unnamed protein product [Rotaria sp. Silwood2]|nr:unnamed protein product [Rotaria sp. Silwood2]CAF4257024.1 unnamed protein product [Rotaria sp. Silwood2]